MGRGVLRGRVDDLKLAIGPFPLKRWKVWGSDEGVNWFVSWLGGRGDGLCDGRPHATFASRTDGNIGVSVMMSENEKWIDGLVVDVENVV